MEKKIITFLAFLVATGLFRQVMVAQTTGDYILLLAGIFGMGLIISVLMDTCQEA